MTSKTVKETFPDWENLGYGEWSKHTIFLKCGHNRDIEIGLYREPLDNEEYAGRYTLQIFDGDDVIFCSDVE